MTKKVIRNFRRENGNFFREKRHSEILVREKNFRPLQTQRQVSATASADRTTSLTTDHTGVNAVHVRVCVYMSVGQKASISLMHFPPVSDFPLFPKIFQTPWKILAISPFPKNDLFSH